MTTLMMLAMAVSTFTCLAPVTQWNPAVVRCRQAGLSRPRVD